MPWKRACGCGISSAFRRWPSPWGPPNTEATLRRACALGVDRAVLLSDRCFGGADTLATSRVLSAAIERLGQEQEVGIVFCGKQTIDGDTAQVGPGIASRLGLHQLTLVDRILSLDLERKTIRVQRKLEGRHEIVEAPLPVITVVRELNRPRYPTVPMRLAAQETELEVWDNGVLQLDVQSVGLKGSPTWVSKIFSPFRDQGEIIGDGVRDPEGTAALLIDKLLSKDLLALKRGNPLASSPPGIERNEGKETYGTEQEAEKTAWQSALSRWQMYRLRRALRERLSRRLHRHERGRRAGHRWGEMYRVRQVRQGLPR